MSRLVVLGAMAVALAPGAAHASKSEARQLVRLSDLGPGYQVGDDSSCAIGPTYEGASPRLRRFNDGHRSYRGCSIDFGELWRPPNAGPRPEAVISVALRFSSRADAQAAFRIAPEFADYNLGISPRSMKPLRPAPALGDQAGRYLTNDALVDGELRRPAVVLIWRTGRTLSLVLVAGKAEAAMAEALRLANTQQQRVVKPTPLPAHANDDRFVSLDNPGVDVPIHWLGPRFRAPGLLPLTFDAGQVTRAGEPGPGSLADIEYTAKARGKRSPGVDLHIWRAAAWARYSRTRTGRLVWAARCTRRTRVALPTGHAVLFSGHTRRQRRCGRRPDLFLAHVFLPGTVVTVNQPLCRMCVDREPGPDAWNSPRGMRAVVTGLAVRPKQ